MMHRIYLAIFLFLSAQLKAQTNHTVLFDFGNQYPSAAATQELTGFLAGLHQDKIERVLVTGHTDTRGTGSFNRLLSDRRLQNVVEILQGRLGTTIPVTANSYGEDSLLTTDENRQQINRRVQITVFYKQEVSTAAAIPPSEKAIQLQPFFEDVSPQNFQINLDDTVIVTGKDGTFLKIAPGTIQDRNGAVMHGHANLVLREYYSSGDIILSGMNTVSTEGLLQTGGMFKLTIIKSNDTMAQATLKPVEIRMPVKDNTLSDMNVFAMNHTATDSSRLWRNTGAAFKQLISYWDWPYSQKFDQAHLPKDFAYHSWSNGRRQHEDFRVEAPSIFRLRRKVPNEKNVKLDVVKKDSLTLDVNLGIHYRRRGRRLFGVRDFDTSFSVSYMEQQYQAYVSNLALVNCDRFYKASNKTDFYVYTPQCNGANVLVYFKKQHAYLPAKWKNGRYEVTDVPANEPVCLVAFGKKGDTYHFGKKDARLSKEGSAEVLMTRLTKEEFEKEMKGL
ncbi:MAG: OmpA family protein [Bacteroidota bacterium]